MLDLGLARVRPPKDRRRMIPDPLLDLCSPTKGGNESREIGAGMKSCKTPHMLSNHDFSALSRLIASEDPNTGWK